MLSYKFWLISMGMKKKKILEKLVETLSLVKLMLSRKLQPLICTITKQALHRGAFCQFPFRWIYFYGSNKSTGKETGKTHLCAMMYWWRPRWVSDKKYQMKSYISHSIQSTNSIQWYQYVLWGLLSEPFWEKKSEKYLIARPHDVDRHTVKPQARAHLSISSTPKDFWTVMLMYCDLWPKGSKIE